MKSKALCVSLFTLGSNVEAGEEKWVDDNTVEAIKRITRGGNISARAS